MLVLVTGGAGFIGSHLCERLVADGNDVVALDDFSTGSRANLDRLLGRPGFRLIEADVRQRLSSWDGPLPDIVFHLAAAVGVRTILENPYTSLEVNLRGTERVLAAATKWGCRLVVTSSSEVYGKNDDGRLSEQADRILGSGNVARWWYAVAKMADEALTLASHREGKLQALVVRLFNTVGPRQSPAYGMVLPTLVRQALQGQPLTVYGDGEQTRCFTHVNDVINAMVALAQTPEAYGQVFNIGQSAEISINNLAQRVLEMTGSQSPIQHIPYDAAYGASYEDMRRRVPDCSLLQSTLGFAPTDRLDEAILAIANHHRQGPESCASA